ncbi:MAG: TRAP transporter large permease [Deferrisomatales bacterium]
MSALTAGWVGTLLMVILFFTGMPIAYAMALVGLAGFTYVVNFPAALNLLARDFYGVYSSYGLTIIPLFVLMGQVACNTGVGTQLYDAAYKFLGRYRGGLAMATVAACTAFGTVCGSSPATAATMASVGLPEMKRYGYGDALACGSVAGGGGLGMLMPPSVCMIVYGILTEQSIGKLFVASILPAIYITLWFVATVAVYCRLNPTEGPAGRVFPWKDRLVSLGKMWETLVVFGGVMAGLFTGVFTPTEAGGAGAFLMVAVVMARRRLDWKTYLRSLYESIRSSCMVLFLIAGATVYGHFLAVTRVPFEVAGWVQGMALPPWAIMMVIIGIYLVGGCFVDAMALVMLTVPIFFPVVVGLGFDPIWFGVVIVLVSQMGVITPPVGINVFVVSAFARDVPIETIFRGTMPFLLALILGTLSLILFPQIVTVLPNLM